MSTQAIDIPINAKIRVGKLGLLRGPVGTITVKVKSRMRGLPFFALAWKSFILGVRELMGI